MYTVVSEMVILLDAVFLLIYDWRNWHGVLIISFATAADIDRIWTIDAFYKFCQSGDLVESASQIIWWKLFKMPLAWLVCYLHAVWIEKLWNLLSREPPPANVIKIFLDVKIYHQVFHFHRVIRKKCSLANSSYEKKRCDRQSF